MRLLLLLVYAALLPLVSAQADEPEPLLPHASRVALRSAAASLARAGEGRAVERLHRLLLSGGDSEQTLAELREDWDESLAREPNPRHLRTALGKLRSEASRLAKGLDEVEGERRTELARLLVALDSSQEAANELLGNVLRDGRWRSPAELEREAGERRVAALLQTALSYPLVVEVGASDSPALAGMGRGPGYTARGHGLVLHSPTDPERLARIARQALRGLLLSALVLRDEAELPEEGRPLQILLLDSPGAYADALVEARDSGGLEPPAYQEQLDLTIGSFLDDRGWRTCRWTPEADAQAFVLWLLIARSVGRGAQPCLVAGHLNWLCLELFGTAMPVVLWKETSVQSGGSGRTIAARSRTFETETLWRAARRSLFGSRSWMVQRVREGRDPPWARSMLDDLGKVRDEELLKTTLVTAYLQETGELAAVLEATRNEPDRMRAFEAALGRPLDELEREWRAWLLRSDALEPGLLQVLGAADEAAGGAAVDVFVEALHGVRRKALAGQWPEFERVLPDDELSEGARLHALYLDLNPAQKEVWPDVHEEYSGRPGFTPAGSRAGLRSVIAFTDDPRVALEQWMGTFHHRLPLLDPGLFGLGLGAEHGVTVLDVASLRARPVRDHWVVWPVDGERDVPRSFVPELPNPVPGQDQASLGYPITLQVSLVSFVGSPEVTMSLREGARDGPEVPCWFLSPMAPLGPELAPPGAWCLVPKARLKASTFYWAAAASSDPAWEHAWSFRTR